MGIFTRFKGRSFSDIIRRIFGKQHAKIGIYGPPNVGKTTLANRILRDWTGDIMGSVSEVPHETRRAKWKNNIKVENNGSSLNMDIVDTQGIDTKIDFKDFDRKVRDCKAVLINSPSNPTGRIQDIQTLKKIEKLTADLNIPLISDEVYKDLIYERENYMLK